MHVSPDSTCIITGDREDCHAVAEEIMNRLERSLIKGGGQGKKKKVPGTSACSPQAGLLPIRITKP